MTTDNVLIKVDNLCKSFDDVDVLKGINAEIHKGDVMVVIGASGSGKTTLLNCISTIDRVTTGHIYINGSDITRLKGNALNKFRREELGFIF